MNTALGATLVNTSQRMEPMKRGLLVGLIAAFLVSCSDATGPGGEVLTAYSVVSNEFVFPGR